MTHREARTGAATAGALVCAMPLADVLLGSSGPGPLHFIVALLGAGLMLASLAGRLS